MSSPIVCSPLAAVNITLHLSKVRQRGTAGKILVGIGSDTLTHAYTLSSEGFRLAAKIVFPFVPEEMVPRLWFDSDAFALGDETRRGASLVAEAGQSSKGP